jgi:ABC-type uncharacterized transport system permease subunit
MPLSAFDALALAIAVIGYLVAFGVAALGLAARRRAALAGVGSVSAPGHAATPRIARVALAAAFATHGLLLAGRAWRLGDHALADAPSTLLFVTWCATLVGLIIDFGQDLRVLPLFLAPPVILALAYGGGQLAHQEASGVVLPESGRLALRVHVGSIIVAYGAFGFAAILSVMYLLLESQLKKKRFSVWLDLPALDRLERVGGRFVASGFLLLTLSLTVGIGFQVTSGALGAEWLSNPKTVLALATWAACLVLVVLRTGSILAGRRLVIANLAVFGLVLATYFGAPLLASGGHLPGAPARRD